MNQHKSLIRISELLSRFKIEVSLLNSNALLDINIISEDILIPIFNIIFNCNLQNAKYSKDDSNFPSLDLLDESKRIALQITSTSDLQKVKKTLKGIVKNDFYKNFDTFYIYIITQKQKTYDETIIDNTTENLFKFTKQNILDEKDLYKLISSLPYDKIQTIESILENQFSDLKKNEQQIQNNILNITNKLSDDFEQKLITTQLEGNYRLRQKLIEKRIFLEEKLSVISDANQEFSLFKIIEETNLKIQALNDEISETLTLIK
ncbi:SMEK domain-containing protein [Flavobacterium sp. C4GT6]|uniref:SMEK domain-containing protein n=1 Tax=Flavobacterium sp. C4GT6 TaxID=3103818 RepID=UPI002ED53887